MLKILHLISAILLAAFHGLYFFRALYLLKIKGRPKRIDKTSRFLAQVLIPVTLVLGLLIYTQAVDAGPFLPHGLLGLLPLLAILGMNLGRIFFKRRKRIFWLLPALNMTLILAALLTGFF